MSLVVVDGDLISYKSSAASEKRVVIAENKNSGKIVEFNNKTQFNAWIEEESLFEEDFTLYLEQRPEPIENCLHTVKMMLSNIKAMSGCKEMIVVVQGEGNFRDNILLPTKYKGGRENLLRPVHLKDSVKYLVGKYKAELAVGRESDDVLSSYAWEGYKSKTKIVQATADKDANQCAGWLLNWDKMTEPEFNQGLGRIWLDNKGKLRGVGRKWLYVQATLGDPSDCYKPTELTSCKFGEKAAFAAFNPCNTDKECLQVVADLYKRWYPEPIEYTAWNGQQVNSDWVEIAQMYFNCAHMQRWDGDRVNLLETLQKAGVQ